MNRWLALLAVLAGCSAPVVDSQWTERAAMTVARSEHPAVIFEGEIVVAGGLISAGLGGISVTASVEAFDPEAGTWRSLRDLPEPRHHGMAVAVGQRLFVVGGFSQSGFDAVDDVWELVDGVWEERAALPRPVGAGAAVGLEGDVYVAGGAPDGGLFRYHPDDDRWVELTSPRQAREHLAAVAHRGEIWVLGGRWQGVFFASTEIYDPATDTWRPGPVMNESRSGFGATVHDETIYVAGGEVFDPDTALASVERFDQGEWALAGELPFGLHGNPLASHQGTLYLPGGSREPGGVDNTGTMLALET